MEDKSMVLTGNAPRFMASPAEPRRQPLPDSQNRQHRESHQTHTARNASRGLKLARIEPLPKISH